MSNSDDDDFDQQCWEANSDTLKLMVLIIDKAKGMPTGTPETYSKIKDYLELILRIHSERTPTKSNGDTPF